MDRDEVGLGEKVGQVEAFGAGLGLHLGGQLDRVAVDDAHAEALRAARHRLPDATEPDDADRLVVHVLAEHHQRPPDPRCAAHAGTARPPRPGARRPSAARTPCPPWSRSARPACWSASTPAAVQAGTSTLSKPTAWLATIVNCGPAAARNSSSTFSVSIVTIASRPATIRQQLVARDAELVLVHRDVASFLQAGERAIHDRTGHQHVGSIGHGIPPCRGASAARRDPRRARTPRSMPRSRRRR